LTAASLQVILPGPPRRPHSGGTKGRGCSGPALDRTAASTTSSAHCAGQLITAFGK
jgi:hypothetical protein